MEPENTNPELNKYPKTKAEFEQWFMKNYKPDVYRHYEKVGKLMPEAPAAHSTSFGLYRHPFEMQQGVYLAFLREKGIDAEVRVRHTLQRKLYTPRLSGSLAEGQFHIGWSDKSYHSAALIEAIEAGFSRLEAA